MILQIIAGILLLIIFSIILYVKLAPQFGARSKSKSFEKIYHSPNFRDGKFQNLVYTPMAAEHTSMLKNGIKFFRNSNGRRPKMPIETIKFDKEAFIQEKNGIVLSWFGHSTLLLNIDGKIILTDPVFSEKASPFSIVGVKSFEYTNQFSISDMPNIDMLIISHDHYDHLDYQTILQLTQQVKLFYVPLGVAAHLMRWGVPKNKIVELDWWEEGPNTEGLKIICTPSRHFSGRAGVDKDYTLWCSWVIKSSDKSIFFCGDSGYGEHFKQIGEQFGPFDLTMMECGQYNEGWPYIHMNPEESIKAHIDLKGKTMLPIHNGKFNLSIHNWKEPVERVKKEAEKQCVTLILAKPGETLSCL